MNMMMEIFPVPDDCLSLLWNASLSCWWNEATERSRLAGTAQLISCSHFPPSKESLQDIYFQPCREIICYVLVDLVRAGKASDPSIKDVGWSWDVGRGLHSLTRRSALLLSCCLLYRKFVYLFTYWTHLFRSGRWIFRQNLFILSFRTKYWHKPYNNNTTNPLYV